MGMAPADGHEVAGKPADTTMGARCERRDDPSEGGGGDDDEPAERETRVPTFANLTEGDLLLAKMREIVEGGGEREPDERRKCQQTTPTPPPPGRPKSSSDSLAASQEPSAKAARAKRRCAHHSRRSSALPAEPKLENRAACSAESSEPAALSQQHRHHYHHRHADEPAAHRCPRSHNHSHHSHHHHHHHHHSQQQQPNQAPVQQQSKRNSLAHPGAQPASQGASRRSQNESKSSSNQSVSLARESIQSSSIGDNPSQEQPASRSCETLEADGAKRAARLHHPHSHHHHHPHHHHGHHHHHDQQQPEQADNQRRHHHHHHHHRCHHRHKKRLLSSNHTTAGDKEAAGAASVNEEAPGEAPEASKSAPGSSLEAADLCAHHRRHAHQQHQHRHERHDRHGSHQHQPRPREDLPAASKPDADEQAAVETLEASNKQQQHQRHHHHHHHHHHRRHCLNHNGEHHNDGRRRNSRARATRAASRSDEQSKENVALIAENRPAKDGGQPGETGDRTTVVEMETEADKPTGVTLWTSSLDPVERSTDSNLVTAIELAPSEAPFATGRGPNSRTTRDEPAPKSEARRAEPADEAVLTEQRSNGPEMSVELDRKPHSKQLSAFGPLDSGASEAQCEAAAADGRQQSAAATATRPLIDVASSVAPAAERRCRLCWCCCFPCPTVSTRTVTAAVTSRSAVPNKGRGERNNSMANNICAPGVSLEEIRAWSESFDRLMKCPEGRKVFQDFLRCEYSEENILFWTACEELRAEKEAKSIANKARDIYEDYISILSSKEVSLDSRVRDVINQNIKRPTSHIFDEAQLQIYTLMHRDSYPRFINSPMYKRLAQLQQAPSRRTSSAANNAAAGV